MSTVRPTGNLDVAGAGRLEKELATLHGDVSVDLTEVGFVASSGLRILLKQAQRLMRDGGSLSVCGANSTVMHVFAISGFNKLMNVTGDCG